MSSASALLFNLLPLTIILVLNSEAKLITEWTIDQRSSGNLPFGFDSGCIISIDEKHTNQQQIYIFGGKSNQQTLNTIYKWSTSPNTNFKEIPSTATTSSPLPFICHQSIAYNTNNNMIYLSGIEEVSPKYGNIYTFDPHTGINSYTNGTNIPSMPIPVHSSCIVMDNINNLLYIIGGKQSETTSINALQILDIKSNKWLLHITNAPIHISSSACYISPQTESLYVFGGTESNKILRYQTNLNEWEYIGELTQIKYDMNIIKTNNDKLLLIGGVINNGIFTNEIEVFDLLNIGNTILDTPINEKINGKLMTVNKDSSVVIWGIMDDITGEYRKEYMISNKLTTTLAMNNYNSNTNWWSIYDGERVNIYLVAILAGILMIGLACCISSLLCYCLIKTNKDFSNLVKRDLQSIKKIQNLQDIKIEENINKRKSVNNIIKSSNVSINPNIFDMVSTEMDQFMSEQDIDHNNQRSKPKNEGNNNNITDIKSPSEGKNKADRKLALPEQICATNNKLNEIELVQNVYNDYIKMYGYPPKEAKHLVAFGQKNEMKIKYVIAKDIVNNNREVNTHMIQPSINSVVSISEIQYEGLRVKHWENNKSVLLSPSFVENNTLNGNKYFTNSVNNVAR